MAQGDVIQKDLGLVTAYGYALAGGYKGTEEQFKTDFANLMAGKYSGSELRAYDFRNDMTKEPFTSDYGYCFSEILVYGNISYLSVAVTINNDLDLGGGKSITWFCTAQNGTKINKKDMQRYVPRDIASWGGSGTTYWMTSAAISGIDGNAVYEFPKVIRPAYYGGYDLRESGLQSLNARVDLMNDTDKDLTIPSETRVVVHTMFINSIGRFDEYIDE